MKLKIRLLSLVLALCLCLAACGVQSPDPTTLGTTLDTTPSTAQATTAATTAATEESRISMAESANPIKNIILIIGDGMGPEHIRAGEFYDGKTYDFTQWQSISIDTAPITYTGKLSTEATDSAASATAMATGHLTVNKYLGMLPDGTELTTILDIACNRGKVTGIVTTDSLLGATPSGFSAHTRSRSAESLVFNTQLNSGVNLLCGTRDSACTDMAQQIRETGYEYCESYADLSGTLGGNKAYWQLPLAGSNPEVDLADVAIDALNYLDRDTDGFVLMIEQAHIDKFSHNHELPGTCMAVSSLNRTVEAVMQWLGERTDTAVLITADHETGGLVVSDQAGAYANTMESPNGHIYYEYRNGGHTSTNVTLFVHGITADFAKSELYQQDVLKNTGIFYLMLDILNLG